MSDLAILQNYFNWVVSNSPSFAEDGTEEIMVFRGHSINGLPLKPSVFREGVDEENTILKKAKYHACEQLRSFCSDLEKLVLLQHYELKTRLLDFTFNPFIALYFACSNPNDKDKDGEVFALQNICVSEKVSQLIAEYVFQYGTDEIDMNVLLQLAEKYDLETNRNSLIENLSTPQFFYPAYNNSRIRMQKGFFMIAPLISSDTKNKLESCSFIKVIKDNDVSGFEYDKETYKNSFIEPLLIKKEEKPKYLKALAHIGIDESSVFPEFDHLLHTLNNNYPPLIKDCF